MSDINIFTTFLEMGFPVEKINEVIALHEGRPFETMLSWLLENRDTASSNEENCSDSLQGDDSIDMEYQDMELVDSTEELTVENESNVTEDSELKEIDDEKTLKCEECSKVMKSSDVEQHALSTNHDSFIECCENIKVMTDEEKQEAVKKAEELIKHRRIVQQEKEQKKEIEREKSRRKMGQELTHMRQKYEEAELMQAVELKKKEKKDAEMARQKVLADIARDKEERKLRFDFHNSGDQKEKHMEKESVPPPLPQSSSMVDVKKYETCRIQIRLTNGEIIKETFCASEQLSAVKLFIDLNRTDGQDAYIMQVNYPKRVFSEEDFNARLSALGLCPSCVLHLSKVKK